MEQKKTMFQTIAYLTIGALCIIFAIVCISDTFYYHGFYTHVSYEYYGGDAYTGIQQAVADTANNVAEAGSNLALQLDAIFEVIGYIFIVMGLLLIANGINGLIIRGKYNSHRQPVKPLQGTMYSQDNWCDSNCNNANASRSIHNGYMGRNVQETQNNYFGNLPQNQYNQSQSGQDEQGNNRY